MTLQPLAYQPPAPPAPSAWLHHVAQLCGVLPLAFGTFVFLATRASVFAVPGMWTILIGLAAAFVGVTCAWVYLYQARQAMPDDQIRARRAGYRDLAIIAMNFPVALLMVLVGVMLIPGW